MLNTAMECVDVDDLVVIPLDLQEHIFEMGADWAMLEVERLLLTEMESIRALALDRLRQGYVDYGCRAFCWDAKTRHQNVVEELADALVYLVTGPIE
jgi:hypothetical protein